MKQSNPLQRATRNTKPAFVGLGLSGLMACFAMLMGCAFFDETSLPLGTCSHDSDCQSPLVCQASLCVDEGGRAMEIAMQLSFVGAKLPRQVSKLTFVPGSAMPDIAMQPLVTVHVEVTRSSEPIPASVRFKAQRSIAGTTAEVWGEAGSQGSRLELLPGTYEVTVRPASETALPARLFRGVEVRAPKDGGVGSLTLPLVELEQNQRLVMVVGKLELQYLGNDKVQPAQGVSIRALSDDGLLQSQKWIICDGEQNCDGSFELILPGQALDERREYRLQIEPSSTNLDVPKMTLPGFAITPEVMQQAIALTTDTLLVDVGKHRAAGIPSFSPVHGQVLDPEGLPVLGAVVSARGQLGKSQDIVFSSTAQTPTAEDGRFVISMPESNVVEFVLQANVDAASSLASAQLSGSHTAQDLVIRLRPKPVLRGQISGRRSDELIQHAVLTAVPISSSVETVIKGSQSSTTTGSDGSFLLALEPGAYALSIEPPPSSNLPQRRVQFSLESASDGLMMNLTLGRSSVVYGRILGEDDELVANALVEVFATDEEQSQAILMGSAMTGPDGVYRVIIPHPDDFELSTWLRP